MDNKNIDSENNSFFSRGCCKTPKMFENSETVFRHGCSKLDDFDWLETMKPLNKFDEFDCIEVRFKNSRKCFFRKTPEMELVVGDIVAVEASPGHDVGFVTLTGEAARLQIKKKFIDPKSESIKKVYRRARMTDIEKWIAAVEIEDKTMFETRKIASKLNLEMKFNDIEYQGDKTKAIFYYTAEDRVDFRELIKLLAEEFKVRIEMKQIGVRQEASRIGGIGSCGRELCCSTWHTNFKSVTTNFARTQQLSLNPQKLAGQCGKLKCCLNYEYDNYAEALDKFPNTEIILKSKKGEGIYQKMDVFKELMWYSYISEPSCTLIIPLENVKKIIKMNSRSKFPDKLEDFEYVKETKIDFQDAVEQGDLTRFDK